MQTHISATKHLRKKSNNSTQPVQNMKDNGMLLNLFYEAGIIILMPKIDKNLTGKEFYRLKFFNNTLANCIQQYTNRMTHYNQVGLT